MRPGFVAFALAALIGASTPSAECLKANQNGEVAEGILSLGTFEDANDGTFEALKHWPERYLDPEYRRNTSFFRRLAPEVEHNGIARLRADHDSGALSGVIAGYAAELGEVGDSTVFAGWR
ncbi:MAG: hypothetical protein IH958_04430 [Chloroflexi bacterium]|nr:hypothetical protein [Chloroflexota bacterium]